jgi:hypothetical protein
MEQPIDKQKLMVGLSRLILAHLVDLQGGQVVIPLKDLDLKDCVVRLAISSDAKVIVTLMSEAAAAKSVENVPHFRL